MNASRLVRVAAVVLWGALACRAATAEQFGDITGEFITEGFVPIEPPLLKGGGPLRFEVPNESYVVDKKTGGVANVFIYLRRAPANIPRELSRSKEPEVQLTIEKRRYMPHALVVRTDQKLRFTSADPVEHNIHTYTLANPQQNFILKPMDKKGTAVALRAPETLPVPIKDDIDPWMRSTLLVVDHPYAAVTDKEGRFTIKGLPVGEHSFRVWHEQRGYLEREWKVTVVGGKTSQLEPYVIPIGKLTTPRN